MKLKLDLHIHLGEALNFPPPSLPVVERVVEVLRKRGLDGIAITDHNNKQFAFKMKEVFEENFPEFLIIPGQEIHYGYDHIIELFLPSGTFRFVAHPGNSSPIERYLGYIHGLEIENGYWVINKERIAEIAQRYNLLLLSNSDAHSLSEIGLLFNYIEIEELISRTKSL